MIINSPAFILIVDIANVPNDFDSVASLSVSHHQNFRPVGSDDTCDTPVPRLNALVCQGHKLDAFWGLIPSDHSLENVKIVFLTGVYFSMRVLRLLFPDAENVDVAHVSKAGVISTKNDQLLRAKRCSHDIEPSCERRCTTLRAFHPYT